MFALSSRLWGSILIGALFLASGAGGAVAAGRLSLPSQGAAAQNESALSGAGGVIQTTWPGTAISLAYGRNEAAPGSRIFLSGLSAIAVRGGPTNATVAFEVHVNSLGEVRFGDDVQPLVVRSLALKNGTVYHLSAFIDGKRVPLLPEAGRSENHTVQVVSPLRGLDLRSGSTLVVELTTGKTDTSSQLLFASFPNTDSVGVYDALTGASVASISENDGPAGLAVDAAGNLYVANPGLGEVYVYASGEYSSPSSSYQGVEEPVAIAVAADGTVAIADQELQETPDVAIFPPGSNRVSNYLTDPNWAPQSGCSARHHGIKSETCAAAALEGVALDASDNVYVSWDNPATSLSEIDEFLAGSTQALTFDFKPASLGDDIGALAIDKNGNLLVDEGSSGIWIIPPNCCHGGHPSLKPKRLGTFVSPVMVLSTTEKDLYVVENQAFVEVAYPSGKHSKTLADSSGIVGPASIAFAPPPSPGPALFSPPPPAPTPTPTPTPSPSPMVTFLTSGTTWTVPSDWNPKANKIEVIGGGGGAESYGGGGGGGGAYAVVSNVTTLKPKTTVTISIGSGGGAQPPPLPQKKQIAQPSPGGNTYLCSGASSCTSLNDGGVIVGAQGGGAGGSGASGTAPGGSTGVGSVSAGGSGGSGTGSYTAGGGGGGAAGPDGPGAAGGNALGAGGGGGGNGGGSAGGQGVCGKPSYQCGGFGGNNAQGTGGGSPYPLQDFGYSVNGTNGGGGAGGYTLGSNGSSGGYGGSGTEWSASYGSGGGGGGAGIYNTGGVGGNYGAGGGGGATGAGGANGIIVISYVPRAKHKSVRGAR